MRTWSLLSGAGVVALVLVLIGCAPEDAPQTASPSDGDAASETVAVALAEEYRLTAEQIDEISDMGLTFGMNTNHRTDDFINLLIEGAEEAASEYGIELLVSEAGFDANRQLGQIEDLVQQEVNGIFTVAVDSAAISSAILRANEAQIPVVIVGGPPSRGEVVTVLNSTSYQGSYASASYLVESVGGEGRIGVLSIPLALKTIRDRETGTLDAIGQSNMQLVSMQAVWTQDEALAAAENMITANPDLSAIFATWSLAVNGALAAIEASGRDIALAGYDAERAGFQALDDGNPHLLSLSGQQAKAQGRAGVDVLVQSILERSIAEEVLVPTVLVTGDDYRERWSDLYPGVAAPWEE
ncbi:MAG: sugar ABC transporter substrate-binding protein [Spirochaetales bacterium]|nr:sugar ABC transporter substrate-binding protein [Spirochaetales bacterium]